MPLSIGKPIIVQSYKHDRTLHRIWQQATVLAEDDERIIVANERTKVIEANGRFWFTKEPSVTFFYKDRWYNVIGIIKPEGISYYCNLSSPILYDEEALKYIDYDLDVKVSIEGSLVVLDQNEYRKHQAQMAYPKELCDILESEFNRLQKQVRAQEEPFRAADIAAWYQQFRLLKEDK